MALTRKFKDTVQRRVVSDPDFRHALLIEAINELLAGDHSVAKSILRDYINATITFPVLAQKLHKSSKSIHRMLGPKGNPRMDSLAGILKVLQSKEIRLFSIKKLEQEEGLLLRHFPEEYPAYKARVKALVPFVF